MERLGILAGMFIEDVNKEESMVVELFGNIVSTLFKVFLLAGIPFLFYVMLQFIGLF
jgi:hypothetical protein